MGYVSLGVDVRKQLCPELGKLPPDGSALGKVKDVAFFTRPLPSTLLMHQATNCPCSCPSRPQLQVRYWIHVPLKASWMTIELWLVI